jgi:hypothetical protein
MTTGLLIELLSMGILIAAAVILHYVPQPTFTDSTGSNC